MSMFYNDDDEDRLCEVLKAYVEEWGAENVVVSVPAHWSEHSASTLGRVLLKFETDNVVAITAGYAFSCHFEVKLKAA